MSSSAAGRQSTVSDQFRDLLQRGFELHQRAQYADSLAILLRARELDPKDYFVNLLIGIDLLRTDKRAEALPFLKEASRQKPGEEFPYEYLGESEAGLAHYAEAAIAYRKAVEVAPQSADASMAMVDYSLGRFAAIARQLRSSRAGLEAEYRLQALSHSAGDKSAKLDNCDSGIPALERSLALHPGSIDTMFRLSVCYAQAAGQVEKRAQEAGGDPVLVHIMRGDVLLRLQGNSSAAMSEYQAVLAARPQYPDALERLAEAQFAGGQVEAARQSAEAALQIDPHRQSAMRTLAEIAMQERNYTAALPYLRKLASADPADVKTRVQLGTACAETGSLDEALQYLAPALQHGYPDEKGSLHYLLGTVLRRLGRSQEAAQAFQVARQMSDASQRSSRQEQDTRP